MINEKEICVTIAALLEKMAEISELNAGVLALLSSRLPDLSEPEQDFLLSGTEKLLTEAKKWRNEGLSLQELLQGDQ